MDVQLINCYSNTKCRIISLLDTHRDTCTILCRFLLYSRLYCKGQALAPGNVTVAFTERFATGLRFVTSNWRCRHSVCTCGTMNSDPPTTTATKLRGEVGGMCSSRGDGSCTEGSLVVRRETVALSSCCDTSDIRGYPAETLTLRPAKRHYTSITTQFDTADSIARRKTELRCLKITRCAKR